MVGLAKPMITVSNSKASWARATSSSNHAPTWVSAPCCNPEYMALDRAGGISGMTMAVLLRMPSLDHIEKTDLRIKAIRKVFIIRMNSLGNLP